MQFRLLKEWNFSYFPGKLLIPDFKYSYDCRHEPWGSKTFFNFLSFNIFSHRWLNALFQSAKFSLVGCVGHCVGGLFKVEQMF